METSGVTFFLAAAVALAFVAFQVWRGWRLGVVRAALSLAALVGAGLAGWFGGKIAAYTLDPLVPWSPLATGIVAGLLLALVVYAALILASAILFKRTGHQGSGIVRLVYGIGGAFVGLLIGLVFVWAGISAIRGFGALAEARLPDPAAQTPPPSGSQRLATEVAGLKRSLEQGGSGRIVESVDPIPTNVYELITRVALLSNDEEAMLRFLEYPGVEELLQHPRIAALGAEPKISDAAMRRDYTTLLSSPLLYQALADRDLVEKIQAMDLLQALDFALNAPAASGGGTAEE